MFSCQDVKDWFNKPSAKDRIAELEKQVKKLKSQSLYEEEVGLFSSKMWRSFMYGTDAMQEEPITVKQMVRLIANHLDVSPEHSSSELKLRVKKPKAETPAKKRRR